MRPSKNAVVNYVQPPEKEGAPPRVKKAVVQEVVSDDLLRIDHSEKNDGGHIALAHYSEDKTKHNTWHFADQPAEATKKAAA